RTVSGVNTSATYYDDVRVPTSARVAEENAGWPLITNQLNHERVALTSAAPLQQAIRDVRDWARETTLPDGSRVIDAAWVRTHLARVHAHAEYLKLRNWKTAWSASEGELSPAEASATKVFGTEFAAEGSRPLMATLGAAARGREGSPGALPHGRVARLPRSSLIPTIGGGTDEVQGDSIAATALGQPVSRYPHWVLHGLRTQ